MADRKRVIAGSIAGLDVGLATGSESSSEWIGSSGQTGSGTGSRLDLYRSSRSSPVQPADLNSVRPSTQPLKGESERVEPGREAVVLPSHGGRTLPTLMKSSAVHNDPPEYEDVFEVRDPDAPCALTLPVADLRWDLGHCHRCLVQTTAQRRPQGRADQGGGTLRAGYYRCSIDPTADTIRGLCEDDRTSKSEPTGSD